MNRRQISPLRLRPKKIDADVNRIINHAAKLVMEYNQIKISNIMQSDRENSEKVKELLKLSTADLPSLISRSKRRKPKDKKHSKKSSKNKISKNNSNKISDDKRQNNSLESLEDPNLKNTLSSSKSRSKEDEINAYSDGSFIEASHKKDSLTNISMPKSRRSIKQSESDSDKNQPQSNRTIDEVMTIQSESSADDQVDNNNNNNDSMTTKKADMNVVYDVEIKTGDENNECSNTNVFLVLHGETMTSTRKISLNQYFQSNSSTDRPFQPGNLDNFQIFLPEYIGAIKNIVIGLESPVQDESWFLEYICVKDPSLPKEYRFACRRWLGTSCADRLTELTLGYTPSYTQEYRSNGSISFEDTHNINEPMMLYDQHSRQSFSLNISLQQRSFSNEETRISSVSEKIQPSKTHSSSDSNKISEILTEKRSHENMGIENQASSNVSIHSQMKNEDGGLDKDSSSTADVANSENLKKSEKDSSSESDKTSESLSVDEKSQVKNEIMDIENQVLTNVSIHSQMKNEDVGLDKGLSSPTDIAKSENSKNSEIDSSSESDKTSESLSVDEKSKIRNENTDLQNQVLSIHSAIKNNDYQGVMDLCSISDTIKSCPDEDGNMPIHIAAIYFEDSQITNHLISLGVLPDLKSRDGFSPFLLGVINNKLDSVKYFLEKLQVNRDSIDKDGNTALHLATVNGHNQIVAYLLSEGIDYSVKNTFNETPLDIAQRNGDVDLIRIFNKAIHSRSRSSSEDESYVIDSKESARVVENVVKASSTLDGEIYRSRSEETRDYMKASSLDTIEEQPDNSISSSLHKITEDDKISKLQSNIEVHRSEDSVNNEEENIEPKSDNVKEYDDDNHGILFNKSLPETMKTNMGSRPSIDIDKLRTVHFNDDSSSESADSNNVTSSISSRSSSSLTVGVDDSDSDFTDTANVKNKELITKETKVKSLELEPQLTSNENCDKEKEDAKGSLKSEDNICDDKAEPINTIVQNNGNISKEIEVSSNDWQQRPLSAKNDVKENDETNESKENESSQQSLEICEEAVNETESSRIREINKSPVI